MPGSWIPSLLLMMRRPLRPGNLDFVDVVSLVRAEVGPLHGHLQALK